MDDEGVFPGFDEAEGHREARHHCADGEAQGLSNPIVLGLPILLFSIVPEIRLCHQINSHEGGVLGVEAGG